MSYQTTMDQRGRAAPAGGARSERTLDDPFIDLRRGLLVLVKILKYRLFPFGRFFAPWSRLSFAVRFRKALEELGLTYLKLGQFLALRFDILPAEVCLELNNLFESVAPMPSGVAQGIIERELGAPVATLFPTFSAEPIAAASIGQVHDARLPDGQRVAVKVQRAGIMRIFRADIRNLRKLTAFAQSLGVFGRLSATGMVDQFEAWTLREMDFRTEGATAERVARKAGPAVVIPAIHWDLSTARVLTMDFVTGVSATHIRELVQTCTPEELAEKLPGFDLPTALHNFTEASLSQLFVDGFFHGDPHPGNILFLPENRVVFLDFGIFGALTDERRAIITAQIESLAIGNIGASMRAYGQQVTETELTDMDRFRDDCREVLTRWYAALLNPSGPIEDRHLARYTGEMIDVSRRNGLIYDLNYLLFWRAINNLNATLWHIDPEFDLLAQLRTFFEKTRPDAFQRVRSMVNDPAWRESLRDLGGSLVQGLNTKTEAPTIRATTARSDRDERRKARTSGWAMLGIAGVSAAVLGKATSLPMSLTLALVATFVVTALFTSWRLR